MGCASPTRDAEDLKKQYGCAILGLSSDNSTIVVPSPEGREPRELQRLDLNRILDARAEELFAHVGAEVARVAWRNLYWRALF